MSLADDLKPLIHSVRAIPGQLGLRPYTLEVVTKIYAGPHVGDGAVSETSTSITEADGQPPKVRWLSDKEIALGELGAGSVEVGPITPDFATGGTTIGALIGEALSTGDTLHFRLTGPQLPNGALFRLLDASDDRALHYKIRLSPVTTE